MVLDSLPDSQHFVIDDLNTDGFNPLHIACFNNKAENVKVSLLVMLAVSFSDSFVG